MRLLGRLLAGLQALLSVEQQFMGYSGAYQTVLGAEFHSYQLLDAPVLTADYNAAKEAWLAGE